MKQHIAAAVLLCIAGLAQASSFEGKVARVRSQPVQASAGPQVRVSVQVVNGTTGCPFGGWYVYQLGAGPAADMWLSKLMAAKTSDRTVTIQGTGSCDVYGLESIAYMDLL